MEWVPLQGYESLADEKDKPRRLTAREIDHITDNIPRVASADAISAEVNRAGVREWVASQLGEVEISPSAIPALITRIVEFHYRSLAVPGTPVGITAAEAVGATTTQMTLNSVARHEKILFRDFDGSSRLTSIGDWIDSLIAENSESVVHIPENRTEYLELASPVLVPSPDPSGAVRWDKVTAVTRHLPAANLLKITTASGRSVTATASKSLLVFNGRELVQTAGSDVRKGSLLPIIRQIPEPTGSYKIVSAGKDYFFSGDFGFVLGVWMANGKQQGQDAVFSENPRNALGNPLKFAVRSWCESVDLTCSADLCISGAGDLFVRAATEGLLGTLDFVKAITAGFFSACGAVYNHNIYFSTTETNWEYLSYLLARLGIFGSVNDKRAFTIRGQDAQTFCYLLNQKAPEPEMFSKNIVFGNTVLDPVTEITEIPTDLENTTVYDLTVPDTKNFSLFNLLGVADTFHSSGSSKSVGFGIEAMRDIIFARKNPKQEGCVIYFKNKRLTYDEALSSRIKIVGSVVGDFVRDYELDLVENISKFWWHDSGLLEKKIPRSTRVLRLHLNLEEMYKHRVSIKMLANALERESPPSVVAIYGPIGDRIIDLFPVVENISQTLKEKKIPSIPLGLDEEAYLKRVVLPELGNIRVKGISGIRELVVVTIPVLSIILHQRRITREDMINSEYEKAFMPAYKAGKGWLLFTNSGLMRSYGLTVENLAAVCNNAGITVIAETEVYLAVAMPADREIEQVLKRDKDGNLLGTAAATDPSHFIQLCISRDNKARKDRVKELTNKRIAEAQSMPENERHRYIRKQVILPRSDLVISSEFCTAETRGSNFREVMTLDMIDKTRTTCNNIYAIAGVLGIEGARTYAVRALSQTIESGSSYVHPTNIMLIAEFITSRGEPHGATYKGISCQPGGHLSLATLERAGIVFTSSALYARKEDIRNVSASVAVGKRMAIGNGYFDIACDVEKDGEKRIVINDDLFTVGERKAVFSEIGKDDVENALDLLKNLELDYVMESLGGEDADVVASGGIYRSEEIDVLAQVKVGVPVPTPVEKPALVPIVSAGLMEGPTQTPMVSGGMFVPGNLQALLGDISMPAFPTRKLPALPEPDRRRLLTEARREQIGTLEMPRR